jgi:hypothetical protein
MNAPINVYSYSHLLRLAMLERIKTIPPFDACARFARTPARPIQMEHLPFFAAYFMKDDLGPDGDFNIGEARFDNRLHVGYSYFVQNNDDEIAEDHLDAGYWSIMKMLHAPLWQQYPMPDGQVLLIEGVREGTRDHNLKAQLINETPVAELTLELTYSYRMYFEPLIEDRFEELEMRTVIWPPDPTRVPPEIVLGITLPQDVLRAVEAKPDRTNIKGTVT